MSTNQELEGRLAELQAKRLERSKTGREAIERSRLEEEISVEEAVAELGEQNREWNAIFSPRTGEGIAVRAPRGIVYSRFRSRALSAKGASEADMLALLQACLVYPSKESLEGYLERTPGLLDQACAMITDLAGNRAETVAGK